jgi:hypothetical protein
MWRCSSKFRQESLACCSSTWPYSYSTKPGVREFYASEEGSRFVRAVAMVTHSATTSIIGNFFLSLNRPGYPCRLFSEDEQALGWLKVQAMARR